MELSAGTKTNRGTQPPKILLHHNEQARMDETLAASSATTEIRKERVQAMPRHWRLYRLLWWLATPIVPLWLGYRVYRGKEDPVRVTERHGRTGLPRPAGNLFWAHAASVGEMNAILPLIVRLLAEHPQWHALITTGTRSSAALLASKIPPRALHQYVPLDHPAYVKRFLAYWKPQAVLWSESELWPNLLQDTRHFNAAQGGVPMWLINGRMSTRSFKGWQRAKGRIQSLLGVFEAIYAGSGRDAQHFAALARKTPVRFVGNLKYDAPELPVDALELARLQENIGGRPVILASSTHPGEEVMLAETHARLQAKWPDLLTIIVPRHSVRGEGVTEQLRRQGFGVAQRSTYDAITSQVQIYVADTMGELGLFYRLANIVFIGGSLVPHGGQNPLEPIKLGVPTISGLYMQNFADMVSLLEASGGFKRVLSGEALGAELDHLLSDPMARQERAHLCQGVLSAQGGALEFLGFDLGVALDDIAPPPGILSVSEAAA